MMTNSNVPQSGRNRGLIAALVVANLLMLFIGILTIPPNLRGTDEKEPPVLRAEQTAPATQVSEKETPPAATESDDISTPDETSVSFSTEERPDLEDFLWYTEGVLYNGVPAEANIIDNLDQLAGGWKALIIYDPNNEYDSGAMEFLNIALAGTEGNLSLTLDWYLIFWSNEGESFDESGMEDTVFSGKWENGSLWASGTGTIRMTQFYELGGKQYAVGTMDTPDGMPALVALVRP